MPDLDGVVRCSWCEATLFGDDPDYTCCDVTGEAHQTCHFNNCYCHELLAANG